MTKSLFSPALLALLIAAPLAGQDPGVVLRIVGPEEPLRTGTEFGAAVTYSVDRDGTQGWSMGIGHDPEVLELLDATMGATTATVKNGSEPDFLVINTTPASGNGIVFAVVIALVEAITLPAGEDYELLTMDYRVVGDPTLVEPCEPIESSVFFSNEIGDPPAAVVMTINGESVTPTTEDLPVTVRCPGTLEITRCEGDTENVYLEWTLGGAAEWDFLFLYRDAELLATLEPDTTSYTDEGLEPGDYTYTLVTFVVDDPTAPQLIFAFCTATVIPVTVTGIEPAIGYWLGGDTVTIRGTAFTSAETTRVFFTGAEGEEPLELEVLEVLSETELTARTPPAPRLGRYGIRLENERGSAELPDAFEYGFIRGEMNADGVVDLSDAVFELGFLFRGDVGDPACRDALDANDDGALDIADPVRLLVFLFQGGDMLPPPYPGPGSDPSEDDLGCLETPEL